MPLFECLGRDEPDGALRVTLLGEVDMAVADRLSARLRELCGSPRRVRLDLSELRFIDSCGMDALLDAVRDARRAGCALEADAEVSPAVQRIVALAGVAPLLWPRADCGQFVRPLRSKWLQSA